MNSPHDLLAVNRSAEHRLGSMDAIACPLAGTVPGAPIVRFKAGEQVQRNKELSLNSLERFAA